MLKFWQLLLAYLFPMVDEPEEGESMEVDEPEVEEEESDEPEVQASDESEEEEPESRPQSRGSRAIADLRRRTQEAERIANEAREEARRLQARQSPPADRQLEAEEAKLRDPNTSELERWQIESNRALRESRMQSHHALMQAQDMADKTTYTQKSITAPIYGKYEKRVEEKLQEIRSKGGNVPREVILQTLIGQDMLAGNFKAKTSTKTTPVARGKTPGARSDTPAKAGSSDRAKRIARLENTQI